jgi:hypothetical protein
MVKRIARGIITGTVVGATVGLLMLFRRQLGMRFNFGRMTQKAGGAIPMARNSAKRWTSAVRSGTKSLTRKLSLG